ncbi:RING-H2 finger protein ATL39 [Brachypodium distachyon]|uniref:RING-type domain-containing protein n=1 Tax=Brachypodium distachyon TaxID=15368 RepID=A0A0Q3F202_BRADI|nr:RING-H2 finger protein ATL39 [Brachypodium distachyon]KQJ92556.1 hypothetical protein BRADI_4g44448v3 [Brachypodium distachyon]|eukprot:XP_010239553.1 RING-H2 finger protein ATL39 [Brachypodium distachyon]
MYDVDRTVLLALGAGLVIAASCIAAVYYCCSVTIRKLRERRAAAADLQRALLSVAVQHFNARQHRMQQQPAPADPAAEAWVRARAERAETALRIVNGASFPRWQPGPGAGDGDEDCCPACREKMERGQACCVLPACGHEFHRDCMAGWIKTSLNATCPACRTPIADHRRKHGLAS